MCGFIPMTTRKLPEGEIVAQTDSTCEPSEKVLNAGERADPDLPARS